MIDFLYDDDAKDADDADDADDINDADDANDANDDDDINDADDHTKIITQKVMTYRDTAYLKIII